MPIAPKNKQIVPAINHKPPIIFIHFVGDFTFFIFFFDIRGPLWLKKIRFILKYYTLSFILNLIRRILILI